MREGNGKNEYIADEVFPYEFRKRTVIIYAKNIKEINYNSKWKFKIKMDKNE
jgi:hypothetical protein